MLRRVSSVSHSETKDVGAYTVGPCVYADLMASHVFLDQHRGPLNDPGANDKESRRNIFLC